MDRWRAAKWTLVERAAAWRAQTKWRGLSRCVGWGARWFSLGCARLELPRSVGLLEAVASAFPDGWPRSGVRETRGLWHGYRLRLDCADYFQRLAFLLRRYADSPTQWLIRAAARPGDTVIDGGANIGLISLLAAWCVGPEGSVYAFEPNPAAMETLRWHITANGLSQIVPFALGLGDRDEIRELALPDPTNLGAATFAPPPARYRSESVASVSSRTVCADAMTELKIHGSLIVKLDVEGYEVAALRGMSAIIDRSRPLIITEVNPEMLAQAGESAASLAGFLGERGYLPHEYSTERALIRQRRLVLRPVMPDRLPVDTAWVHPGSGAAGRLSRFVRSAAQFDR